MAKRVDEAQELLADLSRMGSHGRAEGENKEEFPRTFHPVPEHAQAFDPDVVLIVGPRGAGKSELFRAVLEFGLLPAIARHAQSARLHSIEKERRQWIPAYPIGSGFPDARGLARFLGEAKPSGDPGLELWFTYLVRVLLDHLDKKGLQAMRALKDLQGGDIQGNYKAFQGAGDEPTLALDRLDAELEKKGSYFFVAYDELDTLGGADWSTMSRAISGLMAFWASYTRRWRRIRAKIFLRTDLFSRHAISGGADLAKLAANRAEITWSDRSLYAMLLKRIANKSEGLLDYCRRAKVDFQEDPVVGWVPVLDKPEDAGPLIEGLVGPYMGTNVKKGHTYRWLLEHVRDGRGQALPRPLVRLVEKASDLQSESRRPPRWPLLLEPRSLRRALDFVSAEHVDHSRNEWRWLDGLAPRLRGQQVPWERRQLEGLLAGDWEGSWGEGEASRPPTDRPREFVDYLVEVGIFRARSDGRIDVPDLFLAGLGLKRKGGVRKK
ncbi:MAG: hypothetical protein HY721_11700 [Planctomycetes bacterium]|nr:hypothetical protein [Planctomycetota bacterium]